MALKRVSLITSCSLLICCTSCKTIRDRQIEFGSGGGFTGMYTTYTLKGDGRLYQRKSLNDSAALIKTLAKREIKSVFKHFDRLRLDTMALNGPGNMNYFIRTAPGKKTKRVDLSWSDRLTAPAPVIAMYTELNNLTTNKKN